MSGEYVIIDEAARAKPSEATIVAIRARYPVEAELDAIYTRKMRRRHGPGYTGVTLDRLVAGAHALIADTVDHPIRIDNACWLSGGASKLQMVFDLAWRGPAGDAARTDRMVLRMEPAASVTESSRRREFEVLEAVAGTNPSPTPRWVDPDGMFLPYPAMIYDFVTGTAKPSGDPGKVSGLGQNYGADLRARLAPQFVGLLAALHAIPVAQKPELVHFERPEVGSNASVIRQVDAIRRLWEEDRVEEEPIMEIVYRWLIANAPPLDHVSIVHGDYRSGNFLFDERSGEISAWLDWEGATLGDRHQDLTYACLSAFGHQDEGGTKMLASGMMPDNALFTAYEAASGLSVDPVRLRYYGMFNRYLLVMLTGSASARASRIAGTHHDVLVNFVVPVGYGALAELRDYYRGASA